MGFHNVVRISLCILGLMVHPAYADGIEQGPPARVNFSGEIGYDARTIRSHIDLLAIQREEIDHQKASFNLRLYLADPRRVYPTPVLHLSGGLGLAGRGSDNTGRGYAWDAGLGVGAHLRLTRWVYLTPLVGAQYQAQQYDRTAGRRELAWKGLWMGLEGTLDGLPPWELSVGAQTHWSSLDHALGGKDIPAGRFTGLVLGTTAGYRLTKNTGLALKYQRGRWESKGADKPRLELNADLVAASLNIQY